MPVPVTVFSRLLRSTRKNTNRSKINFDDSFETKLKEISKQKESNNKTKMSKDKESINKTEMSNSENIYNIAKEIQNPNECPSTITRIMLLKELDCEDLRSREKKEPGSVKIEELWAAYVNINMHIFSKYNPPKQNHKSITTLMPAK